MEERLLNKAGCSVNKQRWRRTCFLGIMNSTGHLPLSDSAVRPLGKAKRGRPRKSAAIVAAAPVVREPAAVGTLTRTKSLLLAALKVWELKQRGMG